MLALDGKSGPWVPCGFEVLPQRGDDPGDCLFASTRPDIARKIVDAAG